MNDEHGVFWTVWEVVPQMSERRRRRLGPPGGKERRVLQVGPFAAIRADFAEGWLTFESRGERRRLAPPPKDWEHFPDGRLAELCARAEPAGRPRRLP